MGCHVFAFVVGGFISDVLVSMGTASVARISLGTYSKEALTMDASSFSNLSDVRNRRP